jgi:hypothetical protein
MGAVLQGDAIATLPAFMKRLISASLSLSIIAVVLFAGVQTASAKPTPRPPKGFFGIAPQTVMTPEDALYMKAGGIETVRLPLQWAAVQPTRDGPYNWSGFDSSVEIAARAGLRVLPSVGAPPRWIARKETRMPLDNATQRSAWSAFLTAAVERYGPGGTFWSEHASVGPGPNYIPAIPVAQPIREWQIWNESNFFYFAYPVSVSRYAQLVTISSKAIKAVKPAAKVILSGLFGDPPVGGRRGISAATFLSQLYKVPGIRSRFDGISLHPYAVDAETLEELVEEFHDVTVENHDHPALYVTEMGWGSQNDFNVVAFEQGNRGQVRQLHDAYTYLIANARRLNLKQVDWFSWKDVRGSCSFCDSVGLFREGPRFKPKPAWYTFVRLTGGRARP